jgi:hypothetical protein
LVNRQKNLLEAFTASANAEKAASEDPAPTGAGGSPSGGPFAEPASRRERVDAPRGSLTDTLLHPENRGGLLALAGVLLTLAFLAGRISRGGDAAPPVAAAGPAPAGAKLAGEPGAPPPLAPAAQQPRGEPQEAQVPLSAAEKALADTRNRYTIKLVEYTKDQDEDLAWNTLNYLEGQGLPAAALYRGERMFIVLGAAAKQAELDELLERAKTMNGPPPRNRAAEFSDAYVEKIDNLYKR